MNWERITSTLKKILRDPAWASLRVLVAIVAIVSSFVIYRLSTSKPENPGNSNRVIIYSATNKNLTDFPSTVAARTRILIDGKDEKDVEFYEYVFDYQGDRPVRTSDFDVPIRGSVPADRKILAIQQSQGASSALSTPTRVDKDGYLQPAREPQIPCEIQTTDQRTFEIKPLLMNPNDWFRVEIYTAAVTTDAKAPKSPGATDEKHIPTIEPNAEITWSCRIAGVQCPADRDISALLATLTRRSDSTDPLDATISRYEGWSVYFIVLFTISNLLLLLLLSRRTGLVRTRPSMQAFLFALTVFLSMATAEILADWWFNDNNLKSQPTASSVLLLLDIATIISLILTVITKRHQDSAAAG
jgi:hypothetical protein